MLRTFVLILVVVFTPAAYSLDIIAPSATDKCLPRVYGECATGNSASASKCAFEGEQFAIGDVVLIEGKYYQCRTAYRQSALQTSWYSLDSDVRTQSK